VAGAGHSFTPLVQTDGILVSLDDLTGIESLDAGRREATVFAGTRLFDLGPALAARGFGMENLGDINRQSLAGAISTGTHGTGVALGNISTQVTGFELVRADGEAMWCDATQNAEVFSAGRVSLGALGILTRIKLRLEPLTNLRLTRTCTNVEACLASADGAIREHRSFEFFWFPYSDLVATKAWDDTQEKETVNPVVRYLEAIVVENAAFALTARFANWFPAMVPSLSSFSARAMGAGSQVDTSHAALSTPRLVRFNEMEYAIPATNGAATLRDLIRMVEGRRMRIFFPVEYRWVRADDIPLSPAYGQDIVTISIHQSAGLPYQEYFDAAEAIFRQHGGRPHWGKMHGLRAEQLRALYPKWDDFARIRAALDPEGRFLSPYLRELLA
jgi:L-gulonolactone oxidase